MRTRLRLGAVSAVALGALLLATVLASPAFAWHSIVTVKARCLDDGQVLVHYKVQAFEKGHEATVELFYELNEDGVQVPIEDEEDEFWFGPHHNQFAHDLILPAGTTGTIQIIAVATWENDEETTDEKSADLPPADKCAPEEPTTSETPTTEEPPPSAPEEPTTTEEVEEATSTTVAPGQLPFTGASSTPMLVAGIGLIGGGLVFLWTTRNRGRHAAR
jgi:hypothetical protein